MSFTRHFICDIIVCVMSNLSFVPNLFLSRRRTSCSTWLMFFDNPVDSIKSEMLLSSSEAYFANVFEPCIAFLDSLLFREGGILTSIAAKSFSIIILRLVSDWTFRFWSPTNCNIGAGVIKVISSFLSNWFTAESGTSNWMRACSWCHQMQQKLECQSQLIFLNKS